MEYIIVCIFVKCNSIRVGDLIFFTVGFTAQGLHSRNDLAMSACATVFILSRFVDFQSGVLRSAWQNMVWNMYESSGTHAVCTIAFSLILNNGCRSQSNSLLMTVTPQWARERLKSPAWRLFTQPFVQVQIKENIELRVTGLCAGNPPVTGELSVQRASNRENISIS